MDDDVVRELLTSEHRAEVRASFGADAGAAERAARATAWQRERDAMARFHVARSVVAWFAIPVAVPLPLILVAIVNGRWPDPAAWPAGLAALAVAAVCSWLADRARSADRLLTCAVAALVASCAAVAFAAL